MKLINKTNFLLLSFVIICISMVITFFYNHEFIFVFSFTLGIIGILTVLYKPKTSYPIIKENIDTQNLYFNSLFSHLTQPIIIIKNNELVIVIQVIVT